MILIADSGASKTDWIAINAGKITDRFRTKGIHPSFLEQLNVNLFRQEFKMETIDVRKLFFFGSGCMQEPNKEKVSNFLSEFFPNAKIQVESDLMGAGKALYKDTQGLVAILGTGSSLVYYNRGVLNYRIPSLGLLLGDEGSGAWLGKQLLNGIFTKNFSDELVEKFSEKYNKTIFAIIEELNNTQQKGKYLSNFVEFIYENKNYPEISDLICNSFDLFFKNYVLKYPENERIKIGFVGSVAYFFKDELSEIAKKYQIQLTSIIQYPLEEIVKNYF